MSGKGEKMGALRRAGEGRGPGWFCGVGTGRCLQTGHFSWEGGCFSLASPPPRCGFEKADTR